MMAIMPEETHIANFAPANKEAGKKASREANGKTGGETIWSVSALAAAVRKHVEEHFGSVRVRGEIGRVSRPASGHIYLDLKDEDAVLSAVIWRDQAKKLRFQPEQGLEALAEGRLTTYSGQSRYQLVIAALQPAGKGALMALLEERRRKLAHEGLFAAANKKPLPFAPDTIGVITSPSGAVIRDIIHRARARWPCRIIIWPIRVQGETSAAEAVAALKGFNALSGKSALPRPDLLIVARGGGSVEDLWPFNDEALVRAAAASRIPLISAIGHETDRCLLDDAADQYAPTPSAAAEIALPRKSEIAAQIRQQTQRQYRALSEKLARAKEKMSSLARTIRRGRDLAGFAAQRFDACAQRFSGALLRHQLVWRARWQKTASRLQPVLLAPLLNRQMISGWAERLQGAAARTFAGRLDSVRHWAALLQAMSYQRVLERGFVLARDDTSGRPVRRAAQVQDRQMLRLQFADANIRAAATKAPQKKLGGKPEKKLEKKLAEQTPPQGRLL